MPIKQKLSIRRTAAAAMVLVGVTADVRHGNAQTAERQYTVVYGELRPQVGILRQSEPLFNHLSRLAGQSGGLIYFKVNTEIGRANFFSIVESWQDAASFAAFKARTDVQNVQQQLTPLLIAPLDERDGTFVE